MCKPLRVSLCPIVTHNTSACSSCNPHICPGWTMRMCEGSEYELNHTSPVPNHCPSTTVSASSSASSSLSTSSASAVPTVPAAGGTSVTSAASNACAPSLIHWHCFGHLWVGELTSTVNIVWPFCGVGSLPLLSASAVCFFPLGGSSRTWLHLTRLIPSPCWLLLVPYPA